MDDSGQNALRPRGRPRKEDAPAPLESVLAAAAHEFSTHGYDGVSTRTLNRKLGVSHNHLNQRFGSKEGLWRATIDWAFLPLVERIEDSDDPSADPETRVRTFIQAFVEHNATRPHLARIIALEASTESDRLGYLFDNYIDRIRSLIVPILHDLQHDLDFDAHMADPIYFLITSGGTAPYVQIPLSTRMGIEFDPYNPLEVRQYASRVADIIIKGIR